MVALGGAVGKAAERRNLLPAPRAGAAAAPQPGMGAWHGSSFWPTQPSAPAAHPARRWSCLQPTRFSRGTFGCPRSLCPGLSFLPGAFAGVSLKA